MRGFCSAQSGNNSRTKSHKNKAWRMHTFTPVDYTPPWLLCSVMRRVKKKKKSGKKKALLLIKIYSKIQKILISNYILRESGNPERISALFLQRLRGWSVLPPPSTPKCLGACPHSKTQPCLDYDRAGLHLARGAWAGGMGAKWISDSAKEELLPLLSLKVKCT